MHLPVLADEVTFLLRPRHGGGVVDGTEQAVFRFTINPLVWWVWYGGMVLVLGGLIVMWPGGGVPAARRMQAGYAVKLVAET